MNLSKSWIIAAKDFRTFRKKKNIIYALIIVPLMIAILLPAVLTYAGSKSGSNRMTPAELVILLPAFAFFYIILAAYLPTPIASYTIVGEKVEKSLEPLLATPTTDGEILLGKGIAAFLPPLAAVLGGSAVFMILMDLATESRLGYYYFPNSNTAIILFLMVPLAAAMSVGLNVVVSSRISDVRTGQQLGALSVLPFAGVYVLGEIGVVDLGSTENLLIIAGMILVLDVLLFFLATATFRREEILTRWK
jgi:ABC-2 type transport system permease protein